ncbi:PQQ-binding-like beta-propeller repeat protein [Streptomyces actinomycinicus]|uniref:PQQ-binding-like beta-propeller repeat protein n=1 Tax=Streptomyces actinomycinicus TaxID=1695166 RepID=A0A937JPU7_9ACTN|nr:serine/threonine-protein kinase [Streptomyces actinomycinicus]MBL1087219.1 PQQ-binding-like beta-propeller repeat protein [Streptomyces actinomycinicus]
MQSLRATDPRHIGPYEVTHRLGAGGMGEVYLGRSRRGLRVAVKVVRAEHAEDRTFRARFRHEVRAAQTVGGAGTYTARVVDADTEAERPWMATEFVSGPNLRDAVLDHGALPEPAVRVLAAALGEALGAIHARGLVHRDLKPSNILLGEDGPRVIDFGIVRALEATSLTRTGAVVGSVGYVSPEQIRNGGQVGPPSDVFSLGAVLAYASAGREPFGEGQDSVVLLRILTRDFDLSGVPEYVRPLVTACLREDPLERPVPAEVVAGAGFTPDTLRTGLRPGWYGPAATPGTAPADRPSGVEYFAPPPAPEAESVPESVPAPPPAPAASAGSTPTPVQASSTGPALATAGSAGSTSTPAQASSTGPALATAGSAGSTSTPAQASSTGPAPAPAASADPAPGAVSSTGSASTPAPVPSATPAPASGAEGTVPVVRRLGAVAPGRRRLLQAFAGGAVAVAGAGAGAWLWQRGTGSEGISGSYQMPGEAPGTGKTPAVARPAVLRWQYDLGGIGGLDGACCALSPDGSVVYAGTSDGALHAISRNGSRRWKVRLGDDVSTPVATADGVYCVVGSDADEVRRLTAVSLSGSPRWTRTLGDRGYAVPVLLGVDLLVSVGGTDAGGLRSYASDGSTKWTAKTPAGPTGTPLVSGDAIYTGSFGDALLALDARDGSRTWQVAAGTDVRAVALAGGTLIADTAGVRQGFRVTDGRRLWRREAYAAAMTAGDRASAVGTDSRSVYAVRAVDGSVAWTYTVADDQADPRAVTAGDTVYARAGDRVWALDLNGRKRWGAALGRAARDDQHTPVVRGRRLYVPSGTGIAAVDLET